jgi:nucleotide-binding universal stress UspA family protein
VTTARSAGSVGSFPDRRKPEHAMSFSTMMVHVDVEHDSKQRVELAIGLADRFQAILIGVAGCALWPAFMAGDVGLTESNQYDLQKVTPRFEQRGKTFRAQGRSLKRIEWRSAVEPPGELLLREARAADLLIIGRKRSENDADPGAIVLRAGRPVLLAPDAIAALPLRRVVVAWKDTRECRRAVRDALPFLQQAKEVLLVEIGEHESRSQAKTNLADVAAELLCVVEEEKTDLIVAGGYGHSRLGEWIFGGVTRELLAASPVCCLLSH